MALEEKAKRQGEREVKWRKERKREREDGGRRRTGGGGTKGRRRRRRPDSSIFFSGVGKPIFLVTGRWVGAGGGLECL